MTIDITEQFLHKKAYINSIEIQIKTVTLRLEAEEQTNGEAKNITPAVDILSRRGNTYKVEELTFAIWKCYPK